MDKLEKLFKEKENVQKEIDVTSERMDKKKGMSGHHWQDRINNLEASKRIDKEIDKEIQDRIR